MIDIIIVSYNSKKWLVPCLESLSQSNYDLKNVTVCIEDNASDQDTKDELKEIQQQFKDCFNDIRVEFGEQNVGFGCGNNRAVQLGTGELLFFLNADTTVYRDTLSILEESVDSSDNEIGMWELRQIPYEHPKRYDPITMYTPWVSGAAFVMRRSLFAQIGGFDEDLFMYCEDVDLSWRVRIAGYKLKYIPRASVDHYAYSCEKEIKPIQYIYSIINNLILRHKFGSKEEINKWWALFEKELAKDEPFNRSKEQLKEALERVEPALKNADKWHRNHSVECSRCNFSFLGFDYSQTRDGAFYRSRRCLDGPKVSVIVRTCGRPHVLKEALISLGNQTYNNFEVIIVEDGNPLSKDIVYEFPTLNIKYYSTGKKVGRSKTGNIGMQNATGLYLNFLDDDDVMYADHLEILAADLQDNPDYKIAHSLAYETIIEKKSMDPYDYNIVEWRKTFQEGYNILMLLEANQFPIQTVMFSRSVYLELGGIDTELDFLEDWDLWKRYGIHYKFHFNDKTTSEYRTPADENERKDRNNDFRSAYEIVKHREIQHVISFKLYELIEMLDQIEVCNNRKVKKARTKANRLKKKIRKIKTSFRYRLGKKITFLPGMMRKQLKRMIHNA